MNCSPREHAHATSPRCPFCDRDPFHYVDNGVGMEAAAVTCCELGDLYFRGMRPAPEGVTLSWEEFAEIGGKLSRLSAQNPGEPVAWQYRWKIDGEWVNWRVSDASQKHSALASLEERPLYLHPAINAPEVRKDCA